MGVFGEEPERRRLVSFSLDGRVEVEGIVLACVPRGGVARARPQDQLRRSPVKRAAQHPGRAGARSSPRPPPAPLDVLESAPFFKHSSHPRCSWSRRHHGRVPSPRAPAVPPLHRPTAPPFIPTQWPVTKRTIGRHLLCSAAVGKTHPPGIKAPSIHRVPPAPHAPRLPPFTSSR